MTKEPTFEVALPDPANPLPIPETSELSASTVQFTMIKEPRFELELPKPA
jgi:hypothetical protein